MPLDRASHHRFSKATPPIETPPANPLLAPKSVPNGIFKRESSTTPDSPTPVTSIKRSNGINGTSGPLGINDNAADGHLLSDEERKLCAILRIKPKPYMCIKARLLEESIKNGGILKEKVAKDLCKVRPSVFPLLPSFC